MNLKYSMLVLSVVNFVALIIGCTLLPPLGPIHFNFNMEVDLMASPWWLLIPGILPIICALGYWIEIKIRGDDYKNKKPLSIVVFTIICLLIYLIWLFFSLFASGADYGEKIYISFEILIGLPLGLFFLVIGNYLPIVKRNKTLGLRITPTLNNENVWNKTHKLSGLLSVISGALIVICSIFSGIYKLSYVFFISLGIAMVLSFIIPVIYAYVLYNKEKKIVKTTAEKIEKND